MGEAKRRQKLAADLTEELGARFWEKVERTESCWVWTGAKNRNSYGVFVIDKKHQLAHRVAYSLTHGPLPSSTALMHTCDNRQCVNPAHLVPGTHELNMEDMLAKGRDVGGAWRKTTIVVEGPLPGARNGPWLFRVTIERPNKPNSRFSFNFESRSRLKPTNLEVLKRISQFAFGSIERRAAVEKLRQQNALYRKLQVIFGGWYSVELMRCVRSGGDPTPLLRRFLQEDSPITSRRR